MPLRVDCPECSTQLSVRDEFAGRAVKCPKCGGVIQTTVPAAEQPPPLPAAEQPPPLPPTAPVSKSLDPLAAGFNFTDKPAAAKKDDIDAGFNFSGPPPAGDRPNDPMPTAEPVGPRPVGRPRDRDDDRDRPTSGRPRPRDDDRDRGRPRRRPGRDDDDDYDDRPRRRRPPPSSGGGAGKVLLIVGLVLLLLCGGVGAAVFFAVSKVKDVAQKRMEEMLNPATPDKYNRLVVGSPYTNAEVVLGYAHRPATVADLTRAFQGADAARIPDWTTKVQQNRVLVWEYSNNFVFVAFHPKADFTGRVQMKALFVAGSPSLFDGTPDDAQFAREHGGAVKDDPGTAQPVTVTAATLIADYARGEIAADAKYKGKQLLITDASVEEREDGKLTLRGPASKPEGKTPIVVFYDDDRAVQFSGEKYEPGASRVRVRGTCVGLKDGAIRIENAWPASAN